MEMGDASTTVVCEMASARTPLERECFPQTLMFVEGDRGSVELTSDYWIRTTTRDGTTATRYPPPRYAWTDPAYDIAHASIVEANRNLLAAPRGEGRAETTGEDNLKTIELVFAAYESAETGQAIHF